MCESVPSEGHGSLPGVLSLDRAGDNPFCYPVVGLDVDSLTVEFPVFDLMVCTLKGLQSVVELTQTRQSD